MANQSPDVVVYTKLFDRTGPAWKRNTRQHPFSSWFPNPMKQAFLLEYGSHIYETDWILGPLYARNRQGDFQVGATGTVEEKEDYREAAARELGEEVGILPKATQKYPDPLDQFNRVVTSSYQNEKGKVSMKVYSLYIKDTVPVAQYQHLANLSKSKDDKMFKAGVFVYGKKADILDFMSNKIYHFRSPDNIVGVAAVQAKDVYEHYF